MIIHTYIYTGGEHPLQFKPVPTNLVPKLSEETCTCVDNDNADDEEKGRGGGLYVPPRVMAMPYKQEQMNMQSFPKSQPEKNRLMSELRDEVTDFPAEVQVHLIIKIATFQLTIIVAIQ